MVDSYNMPLTLHDQFSAHSNYAKGEFIKSYLMKPFRLQAGVLSATDTATTFTAINLPSGLADQTVYFNKLRGFARFKAKVVLNLQVNANKFQAGVYKLCSVPFAGVTSGGVPAGRWVDMHFLTQQQRSQLPGVEVDISTQTQVCLELPYIAPWNNQAIGLACSTQFDTTQVRLVPFSPLATGAGQDATAGYTLWGHLEDVVLDIPAFPQSGMSSGKSMPTTQEQKAKNIQSTEAFDGTVKGVKLSKWAGVAGGIMGAASMIPLLTPVAAPAAFFLEAAAGVFAAFGWSKPVNLDVESKIQQDFMYNHNHYNSSDNSRLLSLDERNVVEVLPGFSGTNVDEMAFDVFLTRPTLLTKFTWAATQATGTLLASFTVAPDHGVSRTLDSLTGICHTPVSLLSNYFQFWRGDFVYTFHIVKTPMHTGRLAFVFTPTLYVTAPTPASLDNSVFTLRTLVDLRETTIVNLQIPFHASTCYKKTQAGSSSIGVLSIYVVDELVSPAACAQTIEILPWISAAPGFEFAVARNARISPIVGLAVVATPQSGNFIGDYSPHEDKTMESARKCIGERIMSIRQMTRIGRQYAWSTAYTAAPPATGITTYFPFTISITTRIAATTVNPPLYADFISVISSCFLFSRGGMRVKLYAPLYTSPIQVSTSTAPSATINYFTESNVALPDTTVFIDRSAVCNGINVVVDVVDRGGFEVSMPQYTATHSRSNAACLAGLTVTFTDLDANCPIALSWATTSLKADIIRSGADDFNLGMFISIPFMAST